MSKRGPEFQHKPPPQGLTERRRKKPPENLTETDKEAEAWLNAFDELVRSGKRGDEHSSFGEARDFTKGNVIPPMVDFDIGRLLGRSPFEVVSTKGERKEKSFNLIAVTKKLGCSRREAAYLVSLAVLAERKRAIVLLLESLDYPNVYRIDDKEAARLKTFFKDDVFLKRVIRTSFDRALPVLRKTMTGKGLLKLFEKNNDDNLGIAAEEFQTLVTDKRTEEAQEVLHERAEPNINRALETLPIFEQLFGTLPRESFVRLFPHWNEARLDLLSPYLKRYDLHREGIPREVVERELENMRARVAAREERVREIEMKEQIRTREERRDFLKTAGVGLMLAGGAYGALKLLGTPEEKTKTSDAKPETNLEPTPYTYVPKIEQPRTVTSNNLATETAEFIRGYEQGDVVSIPPFDGMHATAAYTHIESRGRMTYDPEYAIHFKKSIILPENSTKFTVGRIIRDQGVVLYPPEMGKIDPDSILVQNSEGIPHRIEKGDLGRFRITLEKPPREPFLVVYEMREMNNRHALLQADGPQPPVPEVRNPALHDQVTLLDLIKKQDEDELGFARRAEGVIREHSRYPQTTRERALPFDEATTEAIEDCDVANQKLMAALHINGIPAMMVWDTKPAPGHLPHGRLRAQVGEWVIALDATPYQLTEDGYSEWYAGPPAQEQKTTAPQQTEDDALRVRLESLISQYAAKKETPDKKPKEKTSWEKFSSWGTYDPLKWQKEFDSFKEGIWGYAKFLLSETGFTYRTARAISEKMYPRESKEFRDFRTTRIYRTAVNEIMHYFIGRLQRTGAIPEEADPAVWSRSITPQKTRLVIETIRSHWAKEEFEKQWRGWYTSF